MKELTGLNVEEALDQLGHPGRYHVLVLALTTALWSSVAMNNIFPAFAAFNPKCGAAANASLSLYLNTSLPNDTGLDPPNSGHACPPNTPNTIVTEWDLREGRSILASTSTALYFGGIMVGGFVAGPLADRFGRKPVLAACVYGTSLLGIGVYLMPLFEGFVVLRFLMGVCVQGVSTLVIVLCLELFSTRYRVLVILAAEVVWALSIMVTALFGFLLTDWRHLQLALSLPALLTLTYFWWLPESVRWLIKKSRVEEAAAVLNRAASFNSVKLSLDLPESAEFKRNGKPGTDELLHQGHLEEEESLKLKQGSKFWPLIRRIIILFYVWFFASVVYYTLTLGVGLLGESVSQSLLIGSALELAAYIPGVVAIQRFGRRRTLVMNEVLTGLLCIISGISSQLGGASGKTAAVYIALVGRLFAGLCFQVIFLWTAELFPVHIRSTALSLCNCMTRAGGIAAPFFVLLADSSLELPRYLMGGAAMGAALMVLLLPETGDSPLPDTVQESADLGRPHKQAHNVNAHKHCSAEEQQLMQVQS